VADTAPASDGLRLSDDDPGLAVRRPALRFPYEPRSIPCDDAVRLAKEAAARHGLEPGLVLGVMRVESGFVANVVSYASAVGLMQVMPLSGKQIGCGDLFDPAENADCGARILASFLRYYRGDLTLALSGYNAGHGMPDRARKDVRVPKNFQYVEDVLRVRSRWLRHGCRDWD
jgi:soluble lytic murein transglycosylase-like protein